MKLKTALFISLKIIALTVSYSFAGPWQVAFLGCRTVQAERPNGLVPDSNAHSNKKGN